MTDTRLQALYQQALDAPDAPRAAVCPSPERLLALVEHQGNEDDRLATLDHAASCRACAREFELLRALHAASPPARRSGIDWRWLMAASVIIAVVAGTLVLRPSGTATPLVRGGQGETAGLAIALLPSGADGSVLRWHAVPHVVSYSVEVLDAQGTVVASDTTRDTTFLVPALAPAVPATRYEWWVRARLADGSEIRSPLRVFIPPR